MKTFQIFINAIYNRIFDLLVICGGLSLVTNIKYFIFNIFFFFKENAIRTEQIFNYNS